MRQIIFILTMMFTLSFTSCITPTATIAAQEISYYDDYVYSGVTYPVLYIESIPYYFYGERWIVVPHDHYHFIRHYHKPLYFRGTPPINWKPQHNRHYNYNRPRPYSNVPDRRTHLVPNDRPHQNRPVPNVNQRPTNSTVRPNTSVRPSVGNINRNTQRPTTRGSISTSRGGRR